MYKYEMTDIKKIPYLKRNFPLMTQLYKKEYTREKQYGNQNGGFQRY